MAKKMPLSYWVTVAASIFICFAAYFAISSHFTDEAERKQAQYEQGMLA